MTIAPQIRPAFASLASALLLLICSQTRSQTWAEFGDAGELLSNYQNVYGSGALTAITGSISSGDADLFGIFISSPAAFSATTSGISDPQLFLFRLDGTGILGNDDAGGALGLQAQLPSGDSRLTALSPGKYLLGISGYNRDPLDFSNNPLFENHFPGLDLALSAGPLDHWSGGSATGSYTITLTGAAFVPIPEPGTAALVIALAGVVSIGWQARRQNSLKSGRK